MLFIRNYLFIYLFVTRQIEYIKIDWDMFIEKEKQERSITVEEQTLGGWRTYFLGHITIGQQVEK